MLAFIFPVEGNFGNRPDNTLPGGQGGYPDQGLPSVPGSPSHPIVIPPDAVEPGVPTHPIHLPTYPDHTLPGVPGRPAHPIVYPPGEPDNSLPPTPGLPPLVPSHPIIVPESGVHGAVVIPLPQSKMAPPEGIPAGSRPALLWFGPGSLPTVAWIAPVAQPKNY